MGFIRKEVRILRVMEDRCLGVSQREGWCVVRLALTRFRSGKFTPRMKTYALCFVSRLIYWRIIAHKIGETHHLVCSHRTSPVVRIDRFLRILICLPKIRDDLRCWNKLFPMR